MLIKCNFDPKKGYHVGPHRFYECLRCDELLPSRPRTNTDCRCGNIQIDVDAGRLHIQDHSKVLLVEEMGHPFLNAMYDIVAKLSVIRDTLAKLTHIPKKTPRR